MIYSVSIVPSKTKVAGPQSLISVISEGPATNSTFRSPPRVLTFTGALTKCPDRTEAMAEAVTPVPQDNVSSSTPLSKVLT